MDHACHNHKPVLTLEALTTVFARLGLTPYRQQRVRTLPHETKQRIALGRVLLGQAPLLLLDEPYSGKEGATAVTRDGGGLCNG